MQTIIEIASALMQVNTAIESYMRCLLTQTDHAALNAMEAFAVQRHFSVIGHLFGAFIETMPKAVSSRRLFEFGSGYGYSAYWFAKAVGSERHVFCRDNNPYNKERFRLGTLDCG